MNTIGSRSGTKPTEGEDGAIFEHWWNTLSLNEKANVYWRENHNDNED